jgi:hypothetical protein
LLIVALLAIVVGCLFVYFEVADYPDQPPWSGGPSARLAPAGSSPAVAPLWQPSAEPGVAGLHRFSYPRFG